MPAGNSPPRPRQARLMYPCRQVSASASGEDQLFASPEVSASGEDQLSNSAEAGSASNTRSSPRQSPPA
jgi:hypothetical protein